MSSFVKADHGMRQNSKDVSLLGDGSLHMVAEVQFSSNARL
jgi:hypothetical protein